MNAITELIFYIYGTIGVLFTYLVAIILLLWLIFFCHEWAEKRWRAFWNRRPKFLMLGKEDLALVLVLCLALPFIGIVILWAIAQR